MISVWGVIMVVGALCFSLIIFIGVILALMSVKVLRPYEVGLVERLGKYKRKIESGIHFIMPLLENVQIVDLRERVVDIQPQEVICKDNVVVVVDAIIYYQIVDPVKAKYNVNNFLLAIMKLAQTNLRSIIGEMELDETLSGRDIINVKLREELDKITDKWGVKVTRVEIQRIDPPREIQDAMAKQMKAEREKRAMILLAEGEKSSKILKAEGAKESTIRVAEGNAQAKLLRAQAESKAITMVMQALSKADNRYLSLKYIEQLPSIASSADTLVLPYEVTEFLGSIKGLDKLLKKTRKKKEL